LTPLASTGERISFYEAARQYGQKALQVIAMDEKRTASVRLAAAIRCLNCSRSAGGLIHVE
jgi:hypothetical protein